MGRAQRKSYKKKGSVGVISLSAESDKGFAPLTAPPLKEGLVHHLVNCQFADGKLRAKLLSFAALVKKRYPVISAVVLADLTAHTVRLREGGKVASLIVADLKNEAAAVF